MGFDSQYMALAAEDGGGDAAWSIVCHFQEGLNLSRILASKYQVKPTLIADILIPGY
jgi:hypothetical protein